MKPQAATSPGNDACPTAVDRRSERDFRERESNIWKECWIGYPAGDAVIEDLLKLYRLPKAKRPESRLIVGESNAGKTAIAAEFEHRINGRIVGDAEKSTFPVIRVDAPHMGTMSALYSAILRAIGAPTYPSHSELRKQEQVFDLLLRMETRMLIVDEIHHAFLNGAALQRKFLHGLKDVSNRLGISLVALGLPEARHVIDGDPQISNRFRLVKLERWERNDDYARFLIQLCLKMGLQGESNFRSKKLVAWLHGMSGGLTGETRRLMIAAAEQAIAAGREAIDMDLLEQITWPQPTRHGGGR